MGQKGQAGPDKSGFSTLLKGPDTIGPFRFRRQWLLDAVAALHALHAALGVHDALFAGEEGMAPAAHLNAQHKLGSAGGKGIAAGADYLGVGIVLGMDLILHWKLQLELGQYWPACALCCRGRIGRGRSPGHIE